MSLAPGGGDRRGVTRPAAFLATSAAVIAFAVAMGYLEAAVVVYLRAALGQAMSADPGATSAAITHFAPTEIGRELATLVMIGAVGWLAGRSGWERLAWSAVVFGTWDVVYYAGLFVITGWPPALATWDVLFLVPVTWVGPVWAPVAVSVALICGGLLAARRLRHGHRIAPRAWQAACAGAGALLVFASFVVDTGRVVGGDLAPWTGWPLLVAGIVLATVGALGAIHGASDSQGSGPSIHDNSRPAPCRWPAILPDDEPHNRRRTRRAPR